MFNSNRIDDLEGAVVYLIEDMDKVRAALKLHQQQIHDLAALMGYEANFGYTSNKWIKKLEKE